ncbi:dolichyl pyrophosphate Man9 c2 alpha-1-3-glucosyltransferase, partial [Brachionus plicatilis]
IVFDLLIFYPSVVLILNQLIFRLFKTTRNNSTTSFKKTSGTEQTDYLFSLLLILLNPTLVLIDHGHFQYNSISLGLMQLSLYFALSNRSNGSLSCLQLAFCSFFFCLALNYKQMELYHSLPIFFYLLAICLKSNIFRFGLSCKRSKHVLFVMLAIIGSTVIVTFTVLWSPFIYEGFDSVIQVLIRIFPINRGLFEDKVANFWCSLSPFIKVKEHFSAESLAKISLIITILFNLPSCLNLILKPSRQRFMLALLNSALAFYLFSFQVHEKSIIITTVPACLLIHFYPQLISWFILIANFSMLPLFIKDGLVLAFITTSAIFNVIVYAYYQSVKSRDSFQFWPCWEQLLPSKYSTLVEKIFKSLYLMSLSGMIVLIVCSLSLKPPSNLPDLWTLLICIYSFVHFIFFLLFFNLIQLTLKNNDLFVDENESNKSDNCEKLFNFESILTKHSKQSGAKKEN